MVFVVLKCLWHKLWKKPPTTAIHAWFMAALYKKAFSTSLYGGKRKKNNINLDSCDHIDVSRINFTSDGEGIAAF